MIGRQKGKTHLGNVVEAKDFTKPIVRRKALSARNEATLATTIDFGEYGSYTLDEPIAHGGAGLGPSPLQAVLGALCTCEGVTFNNSAREMGFTYTGLKFEAAYTIDIRGRQGFSGVTPHFQSIKVGGTRSGDRGH